MVETHTPKQRTHQFLVKIARITSS